MAWIFRSNMKTCVSSCPIPSRNSNLQLALIEPSPLFYTLSKSANLEFSTNFTNFDKFFLRNPIKLKGWLFTSLKHLDLRPCSRRGQGWVTGTLDSKLFAKIIFTRFLIIGDFINAFVVFQHFSGLEEAVNRNINACKEFAESLRSAYGPCGMNKMIINHIEKLFVTNDAGTIMNELDVSR